MFIAVLWWLGQVVGIGLIAYLLWWLVEYIPAEPFKTVGRVAVGILAVILLIYMVLRLFEILGHPIAGT
jgi:hypothetical protein